MTASKNVGSGKTRTDTRASITDTGPANKKITNASPANPAIDSRLRKAGGFLNFIVKCDSSIGDNLDQSQSRGSCQSFEANGKEEQVSIFFKLTETPIRPLINERKRPCDAETVTR